MFPIKTASSIIEAFKVAVDFIATWAVNDPPYCWFRGIHDRNYSLIPGAYWRKNYDENQVLITFVQEGSAFGDLESTSDWRTYYLAQHHGLPTRLLDWTESFSAALFFAFDQWDGKTIPCIWIIQPCSINEVFLGWHGVIAPETITYTTIWLPHKISKGKVLKKMDEDGYIYNNQWPLAIYPKRANQRLHSQQGAFTIHGQKRQSITSLLKQKKVKVGDHVARIDLTGFDKVKVFSELSMLGVRRSAIYPDIDNFVKQLQQEYEW
ncbi:MAG: FRG domain-containing protein [Planctomycetota bacterium]|jgi:hypothetical protein